MRALTLIKHPEFRVGARQMASVAPGIAAWGLMTGVAMIKSGMSLTEALLMGIFVFAGSSQLAAVPLLAAGAPMWVILATAFCVNLRFVVFSAHLRPYVMHQSRAHRMLSGYFMADLSYVLFTRRYPRPASATDAEGLLAQDAYWAGNSSLNWFSWIVPSLLGIAMANSVPVNWGLDFAGILALLGITLTLITNVPRGLTAALAALVAVLAFNLPLKLNILVAIAAAVVAGLMIEAWTKARLAQIPAERPAALPSADADASEPGTSA